MKRYRYYIFSVLTAVLLASCAKNQEPVVAERSLNVSVTFGTRAGSNTDQEPVINDMRVLIFYGETKTSPATEGNLVFNTFYPFGFKVTSETEGHIVSLVNQIVLPQTDCRKFNVYVILNEEGATQPGATPTDTPTDLHETLGNFSGTETQLQAILNKPVIYTEVLKNVDEPAFLMSGRKSVTYGTGELGDVKTVEVAVANGTSDTVDDYNRGRSMAQIVINKITSEPADSVDYQSSLVPLIFVKSVTLENIPNAIAWADEEGKIGTVGSGNAWETTVTAMTAAQVGKANSDGYYNRDWYGHITRTITNLYAQKVQYTDARFYRTGNNADPNKNTKWSFNVKPYSTTPYGYTYADGKDVTGYNDHKDENALTALGLHDNADPLFNEDAKKILLEEIDPGHGAAKYTQGQLIDIFEAMKTGTTAEDHMYENISYTSYEVTGVQNNTAGGKTKTTISPATLTDDYWTVRLGDKFYVPENISTDKPTLAAPGTATFLRVKLAIAQPIFSFSLNKDKDNRVCTEDCDTKAEVADNIYKDGDGYHYVDPTTLPSPSSLPGESSLSYSYYLDNTLIPVNKNITDANIVLRANSHVVWADDEDTELEIPATAEARKTFTDSHGSYHVYIDGFNRKTAPIQGSTVDGNWQGVSVVVNETLPGSSFSWNVPATDGSETNDIHIYEYIIPVNNNIGEALTPDYSIKRNTRYTVTLYVNENDTYNDLVTRAGASEPFTITAKVTTEKLDEDED